MSEEPNEPKKSGRIIYTPEDDQFMINLYDQGYPSSYIAGALTEKKGQPYSRNAVIGRLNRLRPKANGLSRVPGWTTIAKLNEVRKTKGVPRVERPKKPVIEKITKPSADYNVDIMSLTSQTCRWPVNNLGPGGKNYCGAQTEEGKVYCKYHGEKGIDRTRKDDKRPRLWNR